MRDKLQALRTKIIATRYGNPAHSLSVIVIVGAAGKTTTARLLASILKESGRTVACLTNDASLHTTHALYERFASLKKQRVQTVILEVNDELFSSGALFGLPIETLVVVNENEIAHQVLSLIPKHVIVPTGFTVPSGSVEPYQHISFGEDDVADAKVEEVKLYRHGTELSMTIDHQTKLEVATPLAGKASALDLAAAVAASYVVGVQLDAVQEGIADLDAQDGLFLWYRTNQPYEIVHDNARHDDSVRLATVSARQLAKRRLIIAFDHLPHEDTISFAKSHADRLFVVGERADSHDIDSEATPNEAFGKAIRSAKRDDTVLLLGPIFSSFVHVLDAPEKDDAS